MSNETHYLIERAERKDGESNVLGGLFRLLVTHEAPQHGLF